MTPTEKEHFEVLLGAMREDSLNADEFAQLQEMMAADGRALEYYAEHAMLVAKLRSRSPLAVLPERLPEASEPRPASDTAQRGKRWVLKPAASAASQRWLIRTMAAAILALSIGLVGMILRDRTPAKPVAHDIRPAPTQPSAPESWPTTVGSGLTRLSLAGKTDVIIEGPAEYSIISGSKVRLERGRLTANVPHDGVGFTVVTPYATVVDLGTEFGVKVGQDSTEAHVFKGHVAVSIQGSNAVAKELVAGQARRISSSGQVQDIGADASAFLRPNQTDQQKADDSNVSALDRWLAFSRQLRRRPDLTAYYDFESSEHPGTLADASGHGHDGRLGSGPETTVPVWTTGRWPGKHGLLFQANKGQSVVIPNDAAFNDLWRATSMVAWIKPEFGRDKAGHLLTKVDTVAHKTFDFACVYNNPPKTSWSIYFGGDENEGGDRYSAPVLRRDSRWMCVAVTTQVDGKTVFYLDGVPVSVVPAATGNFVTMSDVIIGHCTWYKQLDFQGIMDELIVFKGQLSDADIRAIYEAGKVN